MANPRRTSHSSNQLPVSQFEPNQPDPAAAAAAASLLNSLKTFLKKPHAFPLLLSLFLLLAWVSLRLQHRYSNPSFRPSPFKNGGYFKDSNSNLVKFPFSSSLVVKDKRGWMVDPVSLALDSGLSGGAAYCASIHVGEIRPGSMRGNHRHHTCNETFVLWGAKTVFRYLVVCCAGKKTSDIRRALKWKLENKSLTKGFSETIIGGDEVAVVASPSGTAHALVNKDPVKSTFFVGCQDKVVNYNVPTSDFNVWNDL